MPILVKLSKWTQTDQEIFISIPLNGVKHSAVNIFTAKNFIKINYPPYYFEAFLLHSIDVDASKCKLYETEARFTLKKLEPIAEWESLESPEIHSKCETKEKIVIENQLKEQNVAKQRTEAKCQLKRDYVSLEVHREQKIKEEITTIRQNECNDALSNIDDQKGSSSWVKNPGKMFNLPDQPQKEHQKATIVKCSSSQLIEPLTAPTCGTKIPEIRKCRTITVNLSQRKFSTPLRESQQMAENEWLAKMHEAKKVNGFVDDDLRPHERDPKWLKDKGDELFKSANYLGAISAYSTGIRLTAKCYDLYLNRSAAHMAIGNYKRCVEDCSAAYELLTPAVDLNKAARLQCLARRGAALCKLGMLKEGLVEMHAALKLNPDNDQLRHDIERIKYQLEKNDDVL